MPMPMRRPMPQNMDNFADDGDPEKVPGADGMPMDDGADDTDAQMSELDDAANAGDQFAADGFFAPVDGATDAGGAMPPGGGAAPQLTPEMLQQLMELLKQQGGGMPGGGGMPPG